MQRQLARSFLRLSLSSSSSSSSSAKRTGGNRMRRPVSVTPPKGKLGVLTPGMGAVSTTFMAGVELVRRGEALPIGSLTQLATSCPGKRTEGRAPRISEFVPLARMQDLVFGGWDIFTDNAYEAAAKSGVLDAKHLDKVK